MPRLPAARKHHAGLADLAARLATELAEVPAEIPVFPTSLFRIVREKEKKKRAGTVDRRSRTDPHTSLKVNAHSIDCAKTGRFSSRSKLSTQSSSTARADVLDSAGSDRRSEGPRAAGLRVSSEGDLARASTVGPRGARGCPEAPMRSRCSRRQGARGARNATAGAGASAEQGSLPVRQRGSAVHEVITAPVSPARPRWRSKPRV